MMTSYFSSQGKTYQSKLQKCNQFAIFCSLAAVALDLLILLCLWLKNIKVWPIVLLENNADPLNLDTYNVDVIIDTSLYTLGIHVQLLLRLYLRCIKKIQDVNTELISLKVWIIHYITYITYYFFVFEKWDGMDDLAMLFEYVVIPTVILFNHSGFKHHYMNNHPDVQDASNALWHILSVCYFQALDFLSNFSRFNQIQPYDVNC